MLENIHQSSSMIGVARKRAREYDLKAIHPADREKYEKDGWQFFKSLKSSVQIKRPKLHGNYLEDRVWTLLYKMNFAKISGEGGAKLPINLKDATSPKSQLDVVVIDKEVAISVECKSASDYKKRPQFQEELAKFSLTRENFVKAVRSMASPGEKVQCVLIMVLSKIILTEQDRERAKQANVLIFDEKDLAYYESLVMHLGPAAKYQILADMLPGKEVQGLSIRVPAIKAKMAGYNCYTFSISPDYLLKISYVSHRSKGKASDINTYQRMLAKSRLKKIQEYISDDGIFPTNIILNFEKGRLSFAKIKQETDSDDLDVGVLGWLDVKPAFKSAWIIDGQHRLFAYSGHDKALKSKLVVLAFEGLKPSKQAELFIDINAKQKSVKQSLLQELYAELHWDSDEPAIRISAIISKAIQDLNNDPEFSLFQRIQTTDGQKDQLRCITLTSLFSQIERKGFFITKEKAGSILEYGPLWAGDENSKTLKRTEDILKGWINSIAESNQEWWDIGAGEGGGLAMNDGISSLISILRSVFEVLEKKGFKLINKSNKDVLALIQPYGQAAGQYLSSFDHNQRKAFRDLRGIAGVTYRARQIQNGMRAILPEYNPDGLDQWVDEQKQQTNKLAKELIDHIEVVIQKYILEELKQQYNGHEDLWWYEGIPNAIRTKATGRMEEDKNKRGGREYYFDLIDYKKIILDNWQLFEETFSFGKGGKEKRLEWLDQINEIRKIVAHASSGKTVKIEDYSKINEYHQWIKQQCEDTQLPTEIND